MALIEARLLLINVSDVSDEEVRKKPRFRAAVNKLKLNLNVNFEGVPVSSMTIVADTSRNRKH